MSALDYELILRRLERQPEPARERAGSAEVEERPVLPLWNAVWRCCRGMYTWSALHLHLGRAPTG